MTRLRDALPAVRKVGFFRFCKMIWFELSKDQVFILASAMAYSLLFAIFPFFIFLLSLLPYLPAHIRADAGQRVGQSLQDVIPKQADVLTNYVGHLLNRPKTSLLSIGLLVTIFAASGGVAMTMAALDIAYDVQKTRPYYIQRPLAILLTLVLAVLILAVLVLIPAGTILATLAHSHGAAWLQKVGWNPALLSPILIIWHILRFSIAILLMFLVVAILYRWGTAARTRFRLFSPGSVFCVIVWILLGAVFRVYLDKFGRYQKTYGTVGGVAILLLFFYIDAAVLLIGAEINSQIDNASAGEGR